MPSVTLTGLEIAEGGVHAVSLAAAYLLLDAGLTHMRSAKVEKTLSTKMDSMTLSIYYDSSRWTGRGYPYA